MKTSQEVGVFKVNNLFGLKKMWFCKDYDKVIIFLSKLLVVVVTLTLIIKICFESITSRNLLFVVDNFAGV